MSKFLVLLVLTLFSFTSLGATMGVVRTHTLVNAQIATGVEPSVQPLGINKTFHATGFTSAGAGASTIEIQVSNDGTNWVVVDTLSLTLGTTVTSDTYVNNDAWKYVRGNVATISGTDGTVSVIMGAQL